MRLISIRLIIKKHTLANNSNIIYINNIINNYINN